MIHVPHILSSVDDISRMDILYHVSPMGLYFQISVCLSRNLSIEKGA